jgi:hypothetical protein
MLFIDGVLQDSVLWDGALFYSDSINVGYAASNGFHFDGANFNRKMNFFKNFPWKIVLRNFLSTVIIQLYRAVV